MPRFNLVQWAWLPIVWLVLLLAVGAEPATSVPAETTTSHVSSTNRSPLPLRSANALQARGGGDRANQIVLRRCQGTLRQEERKLAELEGRYQGDHDTYTELIRDSARCDAAASHVNVNTSGTGAASDHDYRTSDYSNTLPLQPRTTIEIMIDDCMHKTSTTMADYSRTKARFERQAKMILALTQKVAACNASPQKRSAGNHATKAGNDTGIEVFYLLDEIADLRVTNEVCTTELGGCESDLRSMAERLGECQGRKPPAHSARSIVRRSMGQDQSAVAHANDTQQGQVDPVSLNAQITLLRRENADLRDRLLNLQALHTPKLVRRKGDKKRRIAQLTSDLNDQRLANARLQSEVTRAREKESTCRAELGKAEGTQAGNTAAEGQCQRLLASCDSDLKITRKDIDETRKDAERLGKQAAVLQRDIVNKDADQDKLEDDLKDSKKDLALCHEQARGDKKDAEAAALTECHSERDDLKARVASLDKDLLYCNNGKEDVKECRIDVVKAEDDAKKWENKYWDLDTATKGQAAELSACKANLTSSTDALQRQGANGGASQDLTGCQANLTMSTNALSTCNANLTTTANALGSLQTANNTASHNLDECNGKVGRLESELQTCNQKPDCGSSDEKDAGCSSALATCRADLHNSECDKKAAEDAKDTAESDKKAAEDAKDACETDKKAAEDSMGEKDSEITKLHEKIDELEKTCHTCTRTETFPCPQQE